MASSKKVGYLGPEGSWSHEAASLMCPGTEFVRFTDIYDIFRYVNTGGLEGGVVPLENSIEGSVNSSMDMLIECESVYITSEMMMSIDHALLATGSLSEVRTIASHHQALAQCRKNIRKLLPEAEIMETASTSEAASIASRDSSIAAVASPNASKMFGIPIAISHISDHAMNVTRFVTIERQKASKTKCDRTSIVYMLPRNEPGSLLESLREFASAGINMSRIESRPSKEFPGSYYFFIDINGHIEDTEVSRALEHVSSMSSYYRWLGSYPADSWEKAR